MSDKDTQDTARPLSPVIFFDKGEIDKDSPITDFRARVVPADAEEETPPKAKSAPAPASSFSSLTTSEPTPPETPVQHPAAKVDGPTSPSETGSPTSSSPTPAGKQKPPAAKVPSRP